MKKGRRGEGKKGRRLAIGAATLLLFLADPLLPFSPSPILASAAPPPRFRESVSLDTDSAVAKKLSTVDDYLAEKQWEPAHKILEDLAAESRDKLLEVAPGRYLSVARFTNIALASLPAEGLAAYRRKVDPRARGWLETGIRDRNPADLEQVVERAFASSFGDDALLLLGDWAWEAGDTNRARRYWTQIVPIAGDPESQTPTPVLRYPDTDLDLPAVVARLVLASTVEANLERARRELHTFKQLYPAAEGQLAGQSGNLAEILTAAIADAKEWPEQPPSPSFETFAVRPDRSGELPRGVDVGGLQWSVDLPVSAPAMSARGWDSRPPLCYHPVLFEDVVLVCDAERIFGWNVHTGKPAWSADAKRKLDSPLAPSPQDAVLYPPAPGGGPPPPLQPIIGQPQYTLTVDAGKLYARMGTPVTSPAANELVPLRSELVCLDLADAQGKLLWKIETADIEPGWAFEGSPLVSGNRVYVALTRAQPQIETSVACFDTRTRRLLWHRRICSAVGGFAEGRNTVSHRLLTLADDSLFYSTDVGAIAAIDARDGRLRWVVTYEHQPPEEHSDGRLTPCLYHHGVVVAAPGDADELFGIDATSGIIVWRQRLRGGVRHLLGAAGDALVVGGDFLWGLDLAARGHVLWRVGAEDPASHGYGRGLLADGSVYWPTREEVLIVDRKSGGIQRRIPLAARFGASGGNLAIAGGLLLVAQPDRLSVFGEYAETRQKTGQDALAAGFFRANPANPRTATTTPVSFGNRALAKRQESRVQGRNQRLAADTSSSGS
jgi:outer membrane protein assembly factor BamB